MRIDISFLIVYIFPFAMMMLGYHLDDQVKIPYPSTKHTIPLKHKALFFFTNKRTRFRFFRWAVYEQILAYLAAILCTVLIVLYWFDIFIPPVDMVWWFGVVTTIEGAVMLGILAFYNAFGGGK